MVEKVEPKLPFTNGRIPLGYGVSEDNPQYKKLQNALAGVIFLLILLLGYVLGSTFQEYKDAEKFLAAQYNLTDRGCMTKNGHIGYCAILQFNECSAMVEKVPRNLTSCDIAESGLITREYASWGEAQK